MITPTIKIAPSCRLQRHNIYAKAEDYMPVKMPSSNRPISINEYYHEFHNHWVSQKEVYLKTALSNKEIAIKMQKDITRNKKYFIRAGYNINFDEIKLNDYLDGKLNKYINTKLKECDNKPDEYLSKLFLYINTLKRVQDNNNAANDADRYIAIKAKQFINTARIVYNKVHKALLEGYGYVFEGGIGWTCINRINNTGESILDYKATAAKKKEVIEAGGKVYNKEEAKWCAERGIEYEGVDCRVYKHLEYTYEFPLIASKLTSASFHKFAITDYRGKSLRGKSNEDILVETKGNIDKICELPLDVRAKLSLALKADKLLYTNFIRNETQKSMYHPKIGR